MKLPGNSVGISDIIDFRECPQRFAFSMRRHVPLPERFQIEPGEKDLPPEKTNWTNAYGSCFHDAAEYMENEQCSAKEAIDHAWVAYSPWLEPDDLARLESDLETYSKRSMTGYRLVGTELELRAPLYVTEDGAQIYFRGRIDALYQLIANPTVFVSRDYKTSRWPKSEKEVHNDLQQWAYNWLIHWNYPECESLVQQYDQLRFGLIPTTKSPQQRNQIHAWLIQEVKAILADDKLKPKQNEWCAYCPLLMDCRVTHLSTDWWVNRISAMAPVKKEGRKLVIQLTDEIAGVEEYIEWLPKAKKAVTILEKFIEGVEALLKEMPQEQREQYGYRLNNGRSIDYWTGDALRKIHAMLGDDFYQLAGVTKSSIDALLGNDSDEARAILEMADTRRTAPSLRAPKKS